MPFHDLDLHGQPPDRGCIGVLIEEAMEQARRRRVGLRIVHGRGEGVMAALVRDILEEWRLPFVAGWLNPGETRVEASTVMRRRGSR